MYQLFYGIILITSFKARSDRAALKRAINFRVMSTHLLTPKGKELSTL